MEYALLVRTEKGNDYGHIYTNVVWLENDKPRNCVSAGTSPNGLRFEDLRASCQINIGEDARAYGFEVEYHTPFLIRDEDAIRMVRTLKLINSRLEKTRLKRGREITFGDFVNRFACTLDIKKVLFFVGEKHPAYNDCTFEVLNLTGAAERINNLVTAISEAT